MVLSIPGRVVFLVAMVELSLPSRLEGNGEANIAFSLDPIANLRGGVPGQDYPTLAAVPDTGFSCAAQQFPGYYADTAAEAACQVFHICQADGRHDSFLCPNGTMFSQRHLVCDWWYSVDCSAFRQSEGRVTVIAPPLGGEVASDGERPPNPTFLSSSQVPHTHSPILSSTPIDFPLPATLIHSHPPDHHVTPQSSVSQTHQSTHQTIAHHPKTQRHDESHPASIPHDTVTHSHQSTQNDQNVLQPPVTHSQHYKALPPGFTVTHNDQETSHSLRHSTVSQNHHRTHNFIATHHSPFQTLFREDILAALPLRPYPPSGRTSPSIQSSLNIKPGRQHSRPNTNIYPIPVSSEDKRHTLSPQLQDQANTFTISQLLDNHESGFDESVNSLSYSQESDNFITSVPVPGMYDRVEYDNIYSATLFPPNIPQRGDVYEAAKGRVIIDVVKQSDDSPSIPPYSVLIQKIANYKSTPHYIPKVPQSVKENSRFIEPLDVYNLPRKQDESLPRVLSSLQYTVTPSPQGHSSLYQPPHTNHESFSGHPATQSTSKTPNKSVSQGHDPFLHVWRPSHHPFTTFLKASLDNDASLNLIKSSGQPHDVSSVTPKPFHAPSSHHVPRDSFKVIHVTSPSEHVPITSRPLFPSRLEDTQTSQKLPSLEALDRSFGSFQAWDHTSRSSKASDHTARSSKASDHTARSSKVSDHSLPSSHESFLVIHEALPSLQDATWPTSHIPLQADDVYDPKKLSAGSTNTAFEESDHSHDNFAVIRESSLTVSDAALSHQPLPVQQQHRSVSQSFELPHRFAL